MTIVTMMQAYIGIGTNIGDKKENCNKAIRGLNDTEGIEVIKVSALYITDPVGGPTQEDYLNGVLQIDTIFSPGELLINLKRIENEMGRDETPRNYPRIIDLDILTYGDTVLKEKDLVIPHPRMHERTFVLQGFNEIGPDVVHPVLGKTIESLDAGLRARTRIS
jgi:2-amino-4-hydroxy-6-hydroxymethyldihydropteridine diphosphokinase